jgi:hypothetical protein
MIDLVFATIKMYCSNCGKTFSSDDDFYFHQTRWGPKIVWDSYDPVTQTPVYITCY